MQLNVLPRPKCGKSMSVTPSKVGDSAQLFRSKQPVRNPDSHHKTLERPPFAVLPASNPGPVALRIDAPPPKISADPFGGDGGEAFSGKTADFFQAVPGVFCAL